MTTQTQKIYKHGICPTLYPTSTPKDFFFCIQSKWYFYIWRGQHKIIIHGVIQNLGLMIYNFVSNIYIWLTNS